MRSGTDLENSQSHRSYPQNQIKTMTYWKKTKTLVLRCKLPCVWVDRSRIIITFKYSKTFFYKTKHSHFLIIEFGKLVCFFCLMMAMTNTKKMAKMAIVAMIDPALKCDGCHACVPFRLVTAPFDNCELFITKKFLAILILNFGHCGRIIFQHSKTHTLHCVLFWKKWKVS